MNRSLQVATFLATVVVWSLAVTASAAEFSGKIERVDGDVVRIRSATNDRPKVGDRFHVVVEVPGVGKTKLAEGRVTEVRGSLTVGTIEKATGTVAVGQLTDIESPGSSTPSERRTDNSPAPHASPFPAWPGIKPDQAWLGAAREVIGDYRERRAMLTAVLRDGPAYKAGLRTNDVVLAIGELEVFEHGDNPGLEEIIRKRKPGETVSIKIERDGRRFVGRVLLEPMPPDGGAGHMLTAAEAGDVWAMIEIAARYQAAGWDGPSEWPYLPKEQKNVAESIKWLTRASDAGSARAAQYLAGIYRYDDQLKRPAKAIQLYERARSLATPGSPLETYEEATKSLAEAHLKGDGAPRDFSRGVALYRELADHGDYEILFQLKQLASNYKTGKGVPRNQRLATELYRDLANRYRQHAERGDGRAANELGDLYREGDGVAKDIDQALNWYHQAAQTGNRSACTSIGRLAYYGTEVELDYTTALAWFKIAAEKREFLAMHYLGEMYEFGRAVEQDLDKARDWYQKSVDSSMISSPAAQVAIQRVDKKLGR